MDDDGMMDTMLFERSADSVLHQVQMPARNGRCVLVSYTVPWSEASLIAFLSQAAGDARVYWESSRHAVSFAGAGTAAVLMADGADRFCAIRQGVARLFENSIVEAVDAPPAVRPRLFGGFSFQTDHAPHGIWSAFPAAYFVLPRYQLTRAEGRSWLTLNQLIRPGEDVWPNENLSNDCGGAATHRFTDRRLGVSAGEMPARVREIRYPMPPATWRCLVQSAIERISQGELGKVVLARTCDVELDRAIQPAAVLAQLATRYPDCYRFLIEPVPGHAFYGAPPEVLVEVSGSMLRTVAMAGSIGRGATPDEDAALGQALLSSAKDRAEHAFVVEAIQRSLRPLVRTLDVAEEPALRRLHNIQHLETSIAGELAAGTDILSAVEALHPTPAVGGVPQARALQMIAAEEPTLRGWYAAPVGWLDARGDGLFAVAIRSAVSVGQRARLFAGAGIVSDSDPEREWEETGLKFQPLLEALTGAG